MMLFIWFLLHYVIAVVIFAIIGSILELDINIFLWGFWLLVWFYWYIYMRWYLRRTEHILQNKYNQTYQYNSISQAVENIIEQEGFHLKPRSNLDSKLINHFKDSDTRIRDWELWILKLYFFREVFLKYLTTIGSDKEKETLSYVDTIFTDKYLILSQWEESLKKIDSRLKAYQKIITEWGAYLWVDILTILSWKNWYNPIDWLLVNKYVLENKEYVDTVVSKLLKDINLKKLFLWEQQEELNSPQNEVSNMALKKIFEDQKQLDMDEKILKTTLKILSLAQKKYNKQEEELTTKLYKLFERNLYHWTKEQIKASFPTDDKIEESVYALLGSLIINDLEIWDIHFPLWKFDYYSFLLFHFLDKLLEFGYYDNEDEMLDIIKNLQFDSGAGYINMIHERQKYVKKYKKWKKK